MAATTYGDYQTPDDLRIKIQAALSNRDVLTAVVSTSSRNKGLQMQARVAIRCMMSRYWEIDTAFSLDLASAVIRQGVFIKKMEDIDWLHSPAVHSTMKNLITKYFRFLYIMCHRQVKLAVPTLDVDLAWHTHQLTPVRYYEHTVRQSKGTFINHDDKIPETTLSKAFQDTSAFYQKAYKEPYSHCLCWYCEAVRATHTNVVTRMFNKSEMRAAVEKLYNPSNPAPTDPALDAHVSTHNVIQPTYATYAEGRGKLTALHTNVTKAYAKACKLAKKDGRPPPPPIPRSSGNSAAPRYNSNYDWDTGIFYPWYYATYMAYPGVYGGPVGCANMAPDATGNCCSGKTLLDSKHRPL